MKVLHFLPWYSPRTKGGTEVFLLKLAKLQRQYGDEVEIVGPNDSRVTAHECVDGLTTTYFPYPYEETGDQEKDSPSKQTAQKAFLELVDAVHPEVIHLHGIDFFYQTFFEPIAAQQAVKLCLTIHLINVVCPNQTLITETNEVCTKAVDFATCARCISSQRHRNAVASAVDSLSIPLNNFLIRRWKAAAPTEAIPYQRGIVRQVALLDFLRTKVRLDVLSPWFYDVLIRNGFAAERMSIRPNPLLSSESFIRRPLRPVAAPKMRLVFVGRLSGDKGLWVLIEALKGLEDLTNAVELTLIGRHDEPSIVQALTTLRDRGFDLSFTGEASRDEVESQLRRSDYLIFPSSVGEMAPMVIQEALQNELPVICSDLPAAAAFVIEGLNGLLFTRDNAADLRQVLRAVIERKARMSFAFKPTPNVDDVVYSHYRDLYSA